MRWFQSTPEGFVFDVKLFRAFTLHQTPLKAFPTDLRDGLEPLANKAGNLYYKDLPDAVRDELWRPFLEGVEPLKAAGKLGYLLLQTSALRDQEPRQRGSHRGVPAAAGRLSGRA